MSREVNPRQSVPQHGPGPPSTLSSMELSSPTEVSSATEIQQLKQELRLCMGKIKGYETLGHLFQESKQECVRYKQKNEELAKKLDSLTRCISPVEPTAVTSVPCGRGPETKLDIETSSSSLPPTDGISGSVTLEGLIVKTPPTKSPVISSDASPSDGPSFIQISSSHAGSMTSFPSNTSGDVSNPQQQLGNTADADVATLDSAELSSEIKQITDHLRNVGHDGGTTKEDLASDLIKAGVNVIKLQKQTRLLEVMLSQVKEQLAKVEADNEAKQQTILLLQKECDHLTKMAKARNQAVIGNPVNSSEQDESTRGGGLNSVEWVEVMENQITSDAIAGADGGQMTVTTVPLVEKELRHRVEKLSATISELLSVNRNWDEHCRQQELNHSQQVNALNVKLSEAQSRLNNYERSDQQRQLEIDNIVLTAKKQREAEELAKDEAVSELHVERQRRADSEHKCFELNRKITELEHKLQLQQNSSQVESTSRTPWDQQTIQPSSIREQELQTQLLILQEQVNVFKEDFDQERQDRELARTKLDSYRKQSRDLSDQLKACRAQLTQANLELNKAKSESDRWRQSYVKLSSSLQALQRQARPVETRQMSSAIPSLYSEPAVVPQRPSRSNFIQVPNWTCVHCTFNNQGQRHSCEMCGQTKRGDLMQQYTASTVAGGRSVAGLQNFHPDLPYHDSLDTLSLETDRADSSQFKSTGCDSQGLN